MANSERPTARSQTRVRLLLGSMLGLALLVTPAAGLARATCGQPWSCEGVARIVAIGDVHGALAEYESILRASGIIDAAGHWAGGETYLVSTGDLIDRGPESAAVIALLLAVAVTVPLDNVTVPCITE